MSACAVVLAAVSLVLIVASVAHELVRRSMGQQQAKWRELVKTLGGKAPEAYPDGVMECWECGAAWGSAEAWGKETGNEEWHEDGCRWVIARDALAEGQTTETVREQG